MPLVHIGDLENGMVLADDLFSPRGCFLLAEGSVLQAAHLQNLKGWGVLEVDISQQSLGKEYLRKQAELAPFIDRAEGFLYRRFALNNLKKEPEATIFRHAVKRFALSLQQGWDPVVFTEGVPVASDAKFPAVNVVALLKGNIALPSPVIVFDKIIEAIENPETTPHSLAEIISKDASLCARLLHLVNGPGSRFLGQIDSISRAVSLLGTDKLASLLLGGSVASQFGNISEKLLNMDAFWRHSIRCGLFARALAAQLKLPGKEVCFVGGLLHDIGRLVLLDKLPEQYAQVIDTARKEKLPMSRAEKKMLKTDHGFVGKQLAIRWRLPAKIRWMIGGHHSLYSSFYAKEACVVHVADILAHACGHEISLTNEIPPLQRKAWEETGLKVEMLGPLIRQVDHEFKEIIRIFFDDVPSEQDDRYLVNA